MSLLELSHRFEGSIRFPCPRLKNFVEGYCFKYYHAKGRAGALCLQIFLLLYQPYTFFFFIIHGGNSFYVPYSIHFGDYSRLLLKIGAIRKKM